MTALETAIRPSTERRRTYSIGEIRVSLASELTDVADDFASLYRGCESDERNDVPRIHMQIRPLPATRLGRRRYLVYGDGEVIGKQRKRSELLPFLEWGINARVMETRNEFLQLHAASLVRNGQGCVFAGTSGVGKSTTAAGLLAGGWEYLCDEFALIHPTTLQLHAFPKALCLKAGSFGLMKSLGLPLAGRRHYIKGLKGKVAYVNPFDAGVTAVPSPAPIRYVFFPKYVPNAQPRLYPISPARAAFVLSVGVLNRRAFGERSVSVLANVVRQATCYGLETGDIEETCRLVNSVVTSTAAGA